MTSGFWILVGGDYVLWNNKSLAVQDSSGGNSTSFTGSAKAIEADLGVRFALFGPVWLGVDFFYSSTTLHLRRGAAPSSRERDRPLPRRKHHLAGAALESGRAPFE